MNLNLDVVPSTLDQAVALIVEGLTPRERSELRRCSAVDLHHTLGQWLRNNWSLWNRETTLARWFVTNLHVGHADDLSAIILGAVVARVRGENYDPVPDAERFQQHWRALGCNIYGEPASTADWLPPEGP